MVLPCWLVLLVVRMFCNVYFVDILSGVRELYLDHQSLDLYSVRQWYALYTSLIKRQSVSPTKLEIVPQLDGVF